MTLNYKNESLKIEKVDILKIAEEYPTPIYVYSANTIVKNSTLNNLSKSLFNILKI